MRFSKTLSHLSHRLVLVLISLLGATSASFAQFAGGSGSASDPYQIATPAQLAAMDAYANSEGLHFELTADIDLASYLGDATDVGNPGWLPIGSGSGAAFLGNFNGNNHTISGLWVSRPADTSVGLFASIKSKDFRDL
jgi:hypothetical protein